MLSNVYRLSFSALIVLAFTIVFAPSAQAALLTFSASDSSQTLNSPTIKVTERGARGDGLTDDTAAIQAAVDEVAGTGGTVLITDGIYMVDTLVSIRLKSDMTLQMSSGAELKAIPNGAALYAIVRIGSASNVTLVGGTITGDRYQHTSTAGEWGMGVWIEDAHNILIEGVTARDCWGDGFYQHGGAPQSTNITLSGVVADNNRRQGISIENVNGMLIQDSVFKNTAGTDPQAGICIEPYAADQVAENIHIINSEVIDNDFFGIHMYGHFGDINNVVIEKNLISGNGYSGIGLTATGEHQIIENTIINDEYSILFIDGSSGNIIRKNTFNSPYAFHGDNGTSILSENTCPDNLCN